MKKFVSWNVNGLRACVKKGFLESFKELDADIFCLRETKLQEGRIALELDGYFRFWNYAERKGYSGTAIFTKEKPLHCAFGIDNATLEKLGMDETCSDAIHDDEGRIITLEFENYFFTTCYVPNSKDGLLRLPYRMEFEDGMREFLSILSKKKPVVYCGDLNVAHEEIDLKNPSTNHMSAGFSDEEREKMTALLGAGFTDSFRHLYPDLAGAYSWWSYRMKARERNTGWRIDYFIVSDSIKDKIIDSKIHSEIFGSDHCPVEIQLDI